MKSIAGKLPFPSNVGEERLLELERVIDCVEVPNNIPVACKRRNRKDETVLTVPSRQCIAPCTADEDIVASSTRKSVVSLTTIDVFGSFPPRTVSLPPSMLILPEM